MQAVFIRHGMTAGNREKRYIGGRSDEGLCKEGKELLRALRISGFYPAVDTVYASPMRRCLETAEILYPEIRPQIVEGFRECDFGLFENKTAQEIAELPINWEWSGDQEKVRFPGGEDSEAFIRRSVKAFTELMEREAQIPRAAFVVHGGTIMALLSRLDEKRGTFYDYHLENGEGYLCEIDQSSRIPTLRGCRRLENGA